MYDLREIRIIATMMYFMVITFTILAANFTGYVNGCLELTAISIVCIPTLLMRKRMLLIGIVAFVLVIIIVCSSFIGHTDSEYLSSLGNKYNYLVEYDINTFTKIGDTPFLVGGYNMGWETVISPNLSKYMTKFILIHEIGHDLYGSGRWAEFRCDLLAYKMCYLGH